jgi:hypothetical protein
VSERRKRAVKLESAGKMRRMRALLVAALVAAPAAWADGQIMFDKAEREARGLEFQLALKSIDQALAATENDRTLLTRIYLLQGICLATVNQEAKALKSFQILLSLAPEARLEGNYPPRVSTAFFEARGWVGQSGALAAEPLEATIDGAQVKAVRVKVQNDPLKLSREVRFHLVIDGRTRVLDVALQQGAASAPVNAEKVSWWAELLGDKKATLTPVIAEVSPRNERAKAAVAVAPAPEPKPAPVASAAPAAKPQVEASKAPDASGRRAAGLLLAGLGLAVAGAGIGLGVSSAADIARFESAERDADGKIVGMTQREAQALDADQRTKAAVGNVLIIGGGVLAAAGVVIFAASFAGGSTVAVAPAGGGVAISGTF